MCAPSPAEGDGSLFRGRGGELLQQPGLAHSRLSADDDHACPCLIASSELIAHALDHSFPADERLRVRSSDQRRAAHVDPVTIKVRP
jgi:hypothetical protein